MAFFRFSHFTLLSSSHMMGVDRWLSWCVDAVPCQKHIGAGYCARTNGVQVPQGAREKSILARWKGTLPEIGGPGGYPPWRGPGAGPGWRDWEGRLASLPWLSGNSFSIERVPLGVRGAERPRKGGVGEFPHINRQAGRRPARQKGGEAAHPRPWQRTTGSRPPASAGKKTVGPHGSGGASFEKSGGKQLRKGRDMYYNNK